MATKTDFYIGRGTHAEWIGSLERDCPPANVLRVPPGRLALTATDEPTYRAAVEDLLIVWSVEDLGEAHPRAHGWPWPSPTSHHRSDWIITFDPDEGGVFVTVGGGIRWHPINPRAPRQPHSDTLEPPDIAAWLRDPAAPPSVPLPTMRNPQTVEHVSAYPDALTDLPGCWAHEDHGHHDHPREGWPWCRRPPGAATRHRAPHPDRRNRRTFRHDHDTC